MAAFDEPEPAGPAGDLRELPREEVAALLAVELRRLGEEQRLAGQVDAVSEHVGRHADVRAAVEEPVDLLAARGERHRAVEHRDPVGMQAVHLARQREHRLPAERDDDGPRRQRAELACADELERQLPLVDLELGVREGAPDERQRIERAEQPDVAILAGEEQLRPRRAALLVVRPLHLVEHQHVARAGGHLDGAAEDRRVLVDALLAGDEPDPLVAQLRRQPAVRLLGEHSQRPGVDASPCSARKASASCVLPEFVGPRCATTVSGSVRRCGSRIAIRSSARFTAARLYAPVARAWRAAREGRRGGRERRLRAIGQP